jgi:predicted CXXCH cytochrome family protein
MRIGLVVWLLAGSASAHLAGSQHDFSGTSSWVDNQDMCIMCHTPHDAQDDQIVPLWNHTTTTSTFIVYSSGTLDADDVVQPTGSSRACLSCHDGSIAIDAYGGRPGNPSDKMGSHETENLGTDLSNDHPVSFTYNTALATDDGQLHDPSSATTSLGGTIQDDLLSNGNRLECTSCHSPHDDTVRNFLLMPNRGSALCLTCHDK